MNLNWSVQKLQLREIQIRELIKENKAKCGEIEPSWQPQSPGTLEFFDVKVGTYFLYDEKTGQIDWM